MLSYVHRSRIEPKPLLLLIGFTVLLSVFAPSEQARGEQLVGLTVQNLLISFDSATPGTVSTIGPVTGLTAGDALVGIDRRPQGLPSGLPGPNNGRIYGVGVNQTSGTGRIYVIDETSAAATLVSTLAADPADTTTPFPFTTVSGTSFDFNPTVDRLRITSNTGQNLRMNVDNGLVQLDVPLAYDTGDPNLGDSPVDVAVAYSNNFGRATTTVLRGVDIGQDPDALVVHTNPNGGLLQTSLSLPFNSSDAVAYDISGLSGTPYFSVSPAGSGSSSLYAAGPDGVTLVGTIGGGVALRGLAAPVGVPVPEPTTTFLLIIGIAGVSVCAHRRV
jgi:hypothetical protein